MKVSKEYSTREEAKNAFYNICDSIAESGNAGTWRSYANVYLDGNTVTITSSYYARSTLLELFNH